MTRPIIDGEDRRPRLFIVPICNKRDMFEVHSSGQTPVTIPRQTCLWKCRRSTWRSGCHSVLGIFIQCCVHGWSSFNTLAPRKD
ncbi:hypothetical protein P692DRAFT_20139195 [Suillus brevipes Sb2]|nr:hypothetical protein P692DRAFT_20139195 [Suillus brevipes Sb2]